MHELVENLVRHMDLRFGKEPLAGALMPVRLYTHLRTSMGTNLSGCLAHVQWDNWVF